MQRPQQLDACLRALQGPDSTPASSRQATRCSTLDCAYLVHPDDQFGSFCCCKCFQFSAPGWKPKRKHGSYCTRAEATPTAQRGPYIPPVWYRQFQQQRSASAAAAAPIGHPAASLPATVSPWATLPYVHGYHLLPPLKADAAAAPR